MNLYDYLEERFKGNKDYEKFKELFPKMAEYAKRVKVIPWQDEFAVADKNPEVLDEADFWRFLAENGLVSQEEAQKRIKEAFSKVSGIVSKTMGVAFMESNEVSFRGAVPLYVALHELGHCYFKEPDPVWSAKYGGGEEVMWFFIREIFSPERIDPEEAVRFWHELAKGVWDEETRKRAKDLISSVARKILGEDLYKVDEELRQMGYPLDDLYRYALWSGTLPPKDEIEAFHSFLINVLEGKRWRDPFMGRFADELFTEETLSRWKRGEDEA